MMNDSGHLQFLWPRGKTELSEVLPQAVLLLQDLPLGPKVPDRKLLRPPRPYDPISRMGTVEDESPPDLSGGDAGERGVHMPPFGMGRGAKLLASVRVLCPGMMIIYGHHPRAEGSTIDYGASVPGDAPG